MTGTLTPDTLTDAPLTIGGRSFRSRLMVGTGKYRGNGEMVRAIEAPRDPDALEEGYPGGIERIEIEKAFGAPREARRCLLPLRSAMPLPETEPHAECGEEERDDRHGGRGGEAPLSGAGLGRHGLVPLTSAT